MAIICTDNSPYEVFCIQSVPPAGGPVVAVSPTYACAHGSSHVNVGFFMCPADARKLAADLLAGADFADGKGA